MTLSGCAVAKLLLLLLVVVMILMLLLLLMMMDHDAVCTQEDGGCIVDAAWFVSPLGQAAEEGHADVLHELLRRGKAAASIHLAGVGGEVALVRWVGRDSWASPHCLLGT